MQLYEMEKTYIDQKGIENWPALFSHDSTAPPLIDNTPVAKATLIYGLNTLHRIGLTEEEFTSVVNLDVGQAYTPDRLSPIRRIQ